MLSVLFVLVVHVHKRKMLANMHTYTHKYITQLVVVCSRAKSMPPQDSPQWHAGYFEVKNIKAQKTQEETLNTSPSTA